MNDIETLSAERDALAAQNARLRAALEFYGRHEHWMAVCASADNSRLLIANGKNRVKGDGWEEAANALALTPPAALEELRRRERIATLREAATHCEETDLLMPVPEPGTTLRQHGANVCLALARELRDKADSIRDTREKAKKETE